MSAEIDYTAKIVTTRKIVLKKKPVALRKAKTLHPFGRISVVKIVGNQSVKL